MKALTLIQPWATLIALGAKRIETRSWATKHRGWIAITASKIFPRECRELCFEEPFLSALAGCSQWRGKVLPRGEVVALALLKECRPTDYWKAFASCDMDYELAFGDFSAGRFGWYFDQVKALKEPVPCKGALGLWDVPTDLAAAIGVQLPRALTCSVPIVGRRPQAECIRSRCRSPW